MKAHIFQHVPFEGPGSILPWLQSQHAEITYTRWYDSPDLPDLSETDFLLVMGGPMSVNDEAGYPWLRDEKRLVRDAVEAGKAVLGVCLGAQLIATAMGGEVYAGEQKEIGWFPIQRVKHQTGAFSFPESATVFHWHGERFTLPNGAVQLATSACCPPQAFQLGRRTIGLQCHLETTPESAQAIISHCKGELVADDYVQTEAVLRNTPASYYADINRLMDHVLDYLVLAA